MEEAGEELKKGDSKDFNELFTTPYKKKDGWRVSNTKNSSLKVLFGFINALLCPEHRGRIYVQEVKGLQEQFEEGKSYDWGSALF